MQHTLSDLIVTTARKASEHDVQRAHALARAHALSYQERGDASIETLAPDGDPVLVVGGNGLTLYFQGHTFRYHPGMGVNRIRGLRLGRPDWMVEAMALRPGDHLLDATLGLGSDLLVGSYVVGDQGRAVGLESQSLLALVVEEGMRTYVHDVDDVTRALRRIEVVHTPYQAYLAEAPSKTFDVVYFDPMFVDPVEQSRHMIPIRLLANPEPLDDVSLEQACRVARRCVVVKDRSDGPYVQSGRFDRVVGGANSRIAYGIIEVGKG